MTDTAGKLDAMRTALLVMDYQPGILERLPAAPALVARAAQAIAIVRRHGGHIGYVRVAFDDAELKALPDRNMMASRVKGAGPAMHTDSPATAIHPDIAPRPGDIVVRKTRIGAFSTTDLDEQLRERDITTLILAGLSTSGVLLSTVRDAGDRDYGLFVLSDASGDPEADVHAFLMERILPRQAHIIQVADLEGLLA